MTSPNHTSPMTTDTGMGVEAYAARCDEMSEGGKYTWWSGLATLLRSLAAERDALRHDNDMLTTGGVIEVAIRNSSVSDYMAHWEVRALTAEARVAELEGALRPFSQLGEEAAWLERRDDHPAWGFDDATLTWGDFHRARFALSPKGEPDEA